MNEKDTIGQFGLFSSVIVAMGGVGIFSYPAQLARAVGRDGWLVELVAGILVTFLCIAIYYTVRVNSYSSFSEILDRCFGTFLGKCIAIIFCMYNIIFFSIGLRIFSEVIKMYLLSRTPTEFILIIMILAALYIVRSDVISLARFNVIAFWCMFTPLLLVLLFTIAKADFTNIFPLFQNNPMQYLKGIGIGIYTFAGFQILYLFLPLMKNAQKLHKTIFKSIAFVSVIYMIITIFSIAIFTEEHVKELIWPGITMVRVTEIKGAFIERWEGIVMALWVIFAFTTTANLYYFTSDILKRSFKLRDTKISSMIVVPFIYIIALYPENLTELYSDVDNFLQITSIFMLVFLPLLLTGISLLKKGRNGRNEV